MPENRTQYPYKQIICACLLAFAVLVIDAWTKFTVFYTFDQTPFYLIEYPVFQNFFGIDFALTYTPNKGAAWGFLSSWQNTLLSLRIGTIVALIAYLFVFNKSENTIVPLTLIIAGALGNVIDTFIYGHVIDMFLFTFWGYPFAVFNVADAAITIGVFWLCLSSLFEKKPQNHADTATH